MTANEQIEQTNRETFRALAANQTDPAYPYTCAGCDTPATCPSCRDAFGLRVLPGTLRTAAPMDRIYSIHKWGKYTPEGSYEGSLVVTPGDPCAMVQWWPASASGRTWISRKAAARNLRAARRRGAVVSRQA